MSLVNIAGKVMRFVWSVLDGLRRALHLLILLFVFLLLLVIFSHDIPIVPGSGALLLAPRGNIVEQLAGSPVDRAVSEFRGEDDPQTVLRDLIDAMKTAKSDPRINSMVLDLRGMRGGGLSKLEALGDAIDSFRESGKTVVAYSDFYSQHQYYLAAHADEIYMHPGGVVYIDGYGYYRTYLKKALDKLKLDVHVFAAGKYKSYGETYSRNDMSDSDRESSVVWLNSLWKAYQAGVTSARDLDADIINSYVENFVPNLRDNGGNLAQLALDAGFVDALWTRAQIQDRLVTLAGRSSRDQGYKSIHHSDYLQATEAMRSSGQGSDNRIAIVVASGEILDGDHPPGTIGGDSLASLIRIARKDDSVKAVVLRVDSPGGSTFASEVIYDELLRLKASGKKLVVSMSSVAASGGYWISMLADEIWARPTTITGSIGVTAILPTYPRALGWLGVNVDGFGTTGLSGQFRLDKGLGKDARELLELSIDNTYQKFIGHVAANRGRSVEEIDEISQGRVWSGADAQELGLIDYMGGLNEAIESTAALADIADDYSVSYIEKELDFSEALALAMFGKAKAFSGVTEIQVTRDTIVEKTMKALQAEAIRLARFNDPMATYFYCFCDINQ